MSLNLRHDLHFIPESGAVEGRTDPLCSRCGLEYGQSCVGSLGLSLLGCEWKAGPLHHLGSGEKWLTTWTIDS